MREEQFDTVRPSTGSGSTSSPQAGRADSPQSEDTALSSREEWSVVWMGRTDRLLFVEVRDGLGNVWSGSLQKVE